MPKSTFPKASSVSRRARAERFSRPGLAFLGIPAGAPKRGEPPSWWEGGAFAIFRPTLSKVKTPAAKPKHSLGIPRPVPACYQPHNVSTQTHP